MRNIFFAPRDERASFAQQFTQLYFLIRVAAFAEAATRRVAE
jgi:hypothetical protein